MRAMVPFLADDALKHSLAFLGLVLLLTATEEAEVVLVVVIVRVGGILLIVEDTSLTYGWERGVPNLVLPQSQRNCRRL